MGKSFFRVGARLGIMMSGNEDDIRSDGDESNVISRCLPKTWCHQCKMRKQRVTACDNFFSSDKEVRCNGRYCDACIQRHYLEFVPRAGLVSADALEVVHEHTEEIARLKQLCVLLQLQVSEISKQVGIAEKTE